MITKIYLISLIGTIISIILSCMFQEDSESAEDKSKHKEIMESLSYIMFIITIMLCIVFYLSNIYIYTTKYWGDKSIISLSIIIGISISIINLLLKWKLKDKHFKYLDFIRRIILGLSYISWIAVVGCGLLWFVGMLDFFACSKTYVQQDKQKNYKEYSYSIDIVELEKVPYVNITGSRYYIRSAPSIAYYYDITTKNGNTTTQILDGNKYYVERDEDDKYADNPHIEVYNIIKKYTNIYGEEKEDFVTYEYTICVPENSIYYEENN